MENSQTCACGGCGTIAPNKSTTIQKQPLPKDGRYIHIEWKHLAKDGETCVRCGKTGENLKQIIAELESELKPQGVKIDFLETKLEPSQIHESNSILINGTPLETLLPQAQVEENECKSCSCLVEKYASCRAIKYNNKLYEDIPAKLIKQAIYNRLNGTSK